MSTNQIFELRIELKCGQGKTIPATEAMYNRAEKIAAKFGIRTYYDRTWDHGTEFCDGYIYPTSANILQVLDELDAAEVDFDNIDLPRILEESELHRQLMQRFLQGQCGVYVNVGTINPRPIAVSVSISEKGEQ